nr:hypothetical protein [Haloferax sp. CBA1148]
MSSQTVTIRGTIWGMANRVNPAFAGGVVAVSVVALAIVTLLSVQGFGFLMPGEIRTYFEMISDDPNPSVISAIGRQNATLGGVQGLFQLVLIADIVYLRFGGF